jgi:hypothetical protein
MTKKEKIFAVMYGVLFISYGIMLFHKLPKAKK